MITQEQKQEISKLLEERKSSYSSQKEMCMAIPNVSEATAINVLKGRFESISEQKWNAVASFLRYKKKWKWEIVPIAGFNLQIELFEEARENSMAFGVVAQEGYGKSVASSYAEQNKNVFTIECAEYFTKKQFLQEVMRVMGLESSGSIGDMMDYIINSLNKKDSPLLILDEVDKLSDPVLRFFITFYNKLKHSCGFILIATENLQQRILKGIRLKKIGFSEIYTRIGRNFVKLPPHSFEDVENICKANNCNDLSKIHEIYNTFEGDLRRVERMVYAYRKKAAQPTQNRSK